MIEQILNLLNGEKLRNGLKESVSEFQGMAFALHSSARDPHDIPDQPGFLWSDAIDLAIQTTGAIATMESLFTQHLVSRVPPPCPIAASDLTHDLIALPSINERESPEVDFDVIYTIFWNCIASVVMGNRSSRPFAICQLTEDPATHDFQRGVFSAMRAAKPDLSNVIGEVEEAALPPDVPEDLWNANGISIRLPGISNGEFDEVLRADCEFVGHPIPFLYAQIAGNMSHSVLRELSSTLPALLSSLLRSTTYFEQPSKLAVEQQVSRFPRTKLPVLPPRHLIENFPFVRRCIDFYFGTPTKKDSLDRRVRNAVHLLVQADAQPQDSIGLALSIAAIEALLGKKGTDLATVLAESVATLLEPELSRRADAVEFMKDLYDLRSRTLHGELTEGDSKARQNAREIAASVLIAIITNLDFAQRMGLEPKTPDDLFKYLRRQKFEPGLPEWIADSPAAHLWRKPSA